jgi:hypothetical protein
VNVRHDHAAGYEARAPGERQALPFFSECLVEDRLVEREIGHEAFELAILVPPLPQLAELGDAQRAEALLPPVERLLADAELAADLADGRAGLGLVQGQGDLLVGKLARLHHGPPTRRGAVRTAA